MKQLPVSHQVPLSAALFVDVAGSTLMRKELGEEECSRRMGSVMGALAQAVAANGGRVLKSDGDDIFAIFTNGDAAPTSCVQAAIDCQHASKAQGLSVYAGVSCGPLKMVEVAGTVDVEGMCVNMAHRLHKLLAGRPGLILLDANTVDFLAMGLRPKCRGMGTREIKGVGKVDVYSVDWDERLTTARPTEVLRDASSTRQEVERDLEVAIGRIRHVFRPGDKGDSLTVGRSSKCGLQLAHDIVSSRHLEFVWESGNWSVRDFSRHGSWVRLSGPGSDFRFDGRLIPLTPKGSLCLGQPFGADPKGATTLDFEQIES